MMGSFSWRQVRSISLAWEALTHGFGKDVDAVKANPGDVFQTGVCVHADLFKSAVDNA